MFRIMRIVAGALLALVMVLAAGCSGGSSEKDLKADAERRMGEALSQGGAQTKVDLGSKGSVDLSGLPEMLRLPDATPLAHTTEGGPGGGDMYVLQTEADASQVVEHYKQQLAGWKQVHAMEANQMSMLVYISPDETQQVSVVVGTERQKGHTMVRVTIAKR